jgi:hypothetical protein
MVWRVLGFAAVAILTALGALLFVHRRAAASRIDWEEQRREAAQLARQHTGLVGVYERLGTRPILFVEGPEEWIELTADGTYFHRVWVSDNSEHIDAYPRIEETQGLWFPEGTCVSLVLLNTSLVRKLELRAANGIQELSEGAATYRRTR